MEVARISCMPESPSHFTKEDGENRLSLLGLKIESKHCFHPTSSPGSVLPFRLLGESIATYHKI